MLVKDLDEKSYDWKPKGTIRDTKKNKSSLHLKARKLLRQQYYTLQILEEVSFIVIGQKKLYFDFYIPALQIAVEAHGIQHYKFNSFFHTRKVDFIKQKMNDRLKQEWCILNNINIIEFPYFESEEQWKKKIS